MRFSQLYKRIMTEIKKSDHEDQVQSLLAEPSARARYEKSAVSWRREIRPLRNQIERSTQVSGADRTAKIGQTEI